jgi:hypothetical protein
MSRIIQNKAVYRAKSQDQIAEQASWATSEKFRRSMFKRRK